MTLLALLLPVLTLAAQPALSPLPVAGLSERYVVEGVIQTAFRINAGASDYSLLLSQTGSFPTTDGGDEQSARLYATLFLEGSDGASRQWLIQDRVDACPLDLTAEFTDPPAWVSDADADGEPEIWVAYRLACRGDVSPATLKLIGYEGKQKYALRGSARIQLGDSHEGGDFKADPAFNGAQKLLGQAGLYWELVRDERF